MWCDPCYYVVAHLDRLFYAMPELGDTLKKMCRDKPSRLKRFFNACHLLQEDDREVWIFQMLSQQYHYPDSFKRKLNSLDSLPESGLAAHLKEGERMFKRTKTQDDKPSARRQETPPLIS